VVLFDGYGRKLRRVVGFGREYAIVDSSTPENDISLVGESMPLEQEAECADTEEDLFSRSWRISNRMATKESSGREVAHEESRTEEYGTRLE
jgi:hypothetical protein